MYCTVVVVDRVYAKYHSGAGCVVLFVRSCLCGRYIGSVVRSCVVLEWSGVDMGWWDVRVCVCAGDVCCMNETQPWLYCLYIQSRMDSFPFVTSHI